MFRRASCRIRWRIVADHKELYISHCGLLVGTFSTEQGAFVGAEQGFAARSAGTVRKKEQVILLLILLKK